MSFIHRAKWVDGQLSVSLRSTEQGVRGKALAPGMLADRPFWLPHPLLHNSLLDAGFGLPNIYGPQTAPPLPPPHTDFTTHQGVPTGSAHKAPGTQALGPGPVEA